MNALARYSLISFVALMVWFPQPAAAHRLDEYLQATRISVDRDRVTVEIDLTAGALVADQVFEMIDTNRDGKVSSAEGAVYAGIVLDSMTLKMDDRRRPLSLVRQQFPTLVDMRLGVGTIRLEGGATVPPAAAGEHRLGYVNTHQSDIGVYLINALVPVDKQIEITDMRRDKRQHEFDLTYRVVAPQTSQTWTPLGWLFAGLAGLGCVVSVCFGFRSVLRSQVIGILFAAFAGLFLFVLSAQAQPLMPLPDWLDNQEFWRLITELSEPGGAFAQQYMSNEDSAQFVIPALKERTPQNGVYIGVGLEQNFTYLAAIRPKLAFIVDIRRDNMLEHLMYKAMFELSPDRADFLSRLLSRKRPPGLNTTSSVKALFDAYQTVEADSKLYEENLRTVIDHLVNGRKLPLNEADQAAIARILNAFRTSGPYSLRGQGDATNPTYAQLMTATDLTDRPQSYLATEENFRIVQNLENKNLIVPLVGDFAGDKAIVSVGRYLKGLSAAAIVNVFYLSNVERYLFEQGDDAKRFYTNVEALPLDASSIFIRSLTSDISRRLGIPILENPAKWRSVLAPINDFLKTYKNGGIQAYRDLFAPATAAAPVPAAR